MLQSFPQDLVLVGRSTVLIKGIAARVNVSWSLAEVRIRVGVRVRVKIRVRVRVTLALTRALALTLTLPGVGAHRAPRPRATPRRRRRSQCGPLPHRARALRAVVSRQARPRARPPTAAAPTASRGRGAASVGDCSTVGVVRPKVVSGDTSFHSPNDRPLIHSAIERARFAPVPRGRRRARSRRSPRACRGSTALERLHAGRFVAKAADESLRGRVRRFSGG